MSNTPKLKSSIKTFGAELRSFVQRASDNITALRRTVEQRPQAGVQDFQECLDDLEQQVADITDELQQLAKCTAESTSFEELIGHCSAVYHANRAASLALEVHLAEYGYQHPAQSVLEPEHLQDCMRHGEQDALVDVLDGDMIGCSRSRRCSLSTPSSPVHAAGRGLLHSNAARGHLPSRLGCSQPGSPTPGRGATGLLGTSGRGAPQLGGDSPLGDLRGAAISSQPDITAYTAGRAPLTQLRQQQQQQQPRISLGSNTSSTPDGLMISPGVAALASKYATSSAGPCSMPGTTLPEQHSPGGSIRLSTCDKKSPCRDLNLVLATPDTRSPDLPIFGRTSSRPAAAALVTSAADQQQLQLGQEDLDSTGELYSSLIHSNMQGVCRSAADTYSSDTTGNITPPCHRGLPSSSSSPQPPPTGGRLPPEWVSEKLQELQNLQADVTLTLSQMKRCPSRSRTAPSAADSSDSGDEAGLCADACEASQQPELVGRKPAGGAVAEHVRPADHQQPGHPAACVEAHPTNTQQHVGGQTAAAATAVVTASATGTTCAGRTPGFSNNHRATVHHADDLRSVAAAASADLENLMANLSMKYALNDPSEPSESVSDSQDTPTPGAAPATGGQAAASLKGHPQPDKAATSSQLDQYSPTVDAVTPEGAQSPDTLAPSLGLSLRYAAHRTGTSCGAGAQMQEVLQVPAGTAAEQQARGAECPAETETTHGHAPAHGAVRQCTTTKEHMPAPAAAAAAASQEAVLRPVQVYKMSEGSMDASQQPSPASKSSDLQWLPGKVPQQLAGGQQQQEQLTPRAARLQRRQQQRQDLENVCPGSVGPVHATAGVSAAGAVSAACILKCAASQGISTQEYCQLPAWCKTLLTEDLLNDVLGQLWAASEDRSGLGDSGDNLQPASFTVDDIVQLGFSDSKSKTIVSCLHKLGRATLQRSAAGTNVYKLVRSS